MSFAAADFGALSLSRPEDHPEDPFILPDELAGKAVNEGPELYRQDVTKMIYLL